MNASTGVGVAVDVDVDMVLLQSRRPPLGSFPPFSTVQFDELGHVTSLSGGVTTPGSNNNNYINAGVSKLHTMFTDFPSVQMCVGCNEKITERLVNMVADCCYHSVCTQCSVCAVPLRDKCFVKDSKLLCRKDYFRHYGKKCALCKEGLMPNELVQKANQHVYHLGCFRCKSCQKQLEPGDEFFQLSEGKLLCKADYEAMRAKESADDSGNKRPRTIITAKQLASLKRVYNESPKPARHVREQLSLETDLEMRVVQVWFQNRRAKEKRMKKDLVRRKNWSDSQKRNSGSCLSLAQSNSDNSQLTSMAIDGKDDDAEAEAEAEADGSASSVSENGCQFAVLRDSSAELPLFKSRQNDYFDCVHEPAQQVRP